jgi:beta-aspartyl-peptidase (threonine type)
MRLVLAKATVDRLAEATLGAGPAGANRVARWAIEYLARKIDGLGGVILIARSGAMGCAFNTPRMAYAYMCEGLTEPVFGIQRSMSLC